MDGVTPAILQATRRKTIDAQTVLPVFLAALVVTGVLASADVLLVKLVHRHRAETASHVFQRATAARQERRLQESLELFRRALNESPANSAYQLAFAEALRSAGRVREARVALDRLLTVHPANGGANAELARILAEEGDWRNAVWYYRRALYGQWPQDSDLRKLRFELASLLAEHGAREELLA
jgi:tetratricopeptide (TPR) repeat protein